MTIEVRIPIGPTLSMCNRVRLIAHSIREFYPDAIMRVTVGADRYDGFGPGLLANQLGHGAHVHCIPEKEFNAWKGTNNPHMATMSERYTTPTKADWVLLLDADVLALRSFKEMFNVRSGAAVMAHASPFPGSMHKAAWDGLFYQYGIDTPEFAYEHSGWEIMRSYKDSPLYFNTGVVLMCREAHNAIGKEYNRCLSIVRKNYDTYFADQIAFTLAMYKANVLLDSVPLRYNFPNQHAFDEKFPEELAEMRFLHFLRTDTIDREKDFESVEAMELITERSDLTGSNEMLRKRIKALLPRLKQDYA